MATTRYVDPASPSPTAPYTSWATAAHTLGTALQTCVSGDITYVAAGTYALSATLTIPGGVTLECASGPATATLQGNNQVRCVDMPEAGATLRGFTITGGRSGSGAGVRCIEGTVDRCWVTENHAIGDSPKGGGILASAALVKNCVVWANDCTSTAADHYEAFAEGGGIHASNTSTIRSCSVTSNMLSGYYANGAGIWANNGTIDGCSATYNTAAGHWYAYGGGIYITGNVDGIVRNCLIAGNSARTDVGAYSSNWAAGGGVYFNGGGSIESCSICENSLTGDAATGAGLMYPTELRNCIIWANSYSAHLASYGDVGPNYHLNPYDPPSVFERTCTTPLPTGTGNISSNPLFVSGNFRLTDASPCINAGTTREWMSSASDRDGNARINGPSVDMGAFEWTAPDVPGFITPPVATWAYANTTAILQATSSGPYPLTWQWTFNGEDIPGATSNTLTIPGLRPSDLGDYAVRITNQSGPLTSSPVTLSLSPSRLINLSINTVLEPGETVTAGFVTKGGTKTLLVRGAGPVLTPLGVTDALADPRIDLFRQADISAPLLSNDNWGDSANLAQINTATASYTGLPFTSGSKDAALLVPLPLSAGGYSVQATPTTGQGRTLVEVYDADSNLGPRLCNLSANRTITPTRTVTAGFVIQGTEPKQVLIRGVGPSLANYGVPTGFLPDPALTVYDITDPTHISLVATNNDWSATELLRTAAIDAAARAGAGLILTEASKDAAVVLILSPGRLYTAELTSADGGSGTGLVEVYETD